MGVADTAVTALSSAATLIGATAGSARRVHASKLQQQNTEQADDMKRLCTLYKYVLLMLLFHLHPCVMVSSVSALSVALHTRMLLRTSSNSTCNASEFTNRDLAVDCARSTVCVSIVACVGEDVHDGGPFFDTALIGEVSAVTVH